MGLRDKLKGLTDEVTTPEAPAARKGLGGAFSAPGRMMERVSQNLTDENKALRDQLAAWEGSSPVRELDPERVRMSSFANRLDVALNEADPEFRALCEEIEQTKGNVVAVLVRPLAAGSSGDFEYELAYGHRRWAACRKLKLPLRAIIRELTDQELVLAMDAENRQREDLSPYEYGREYKLWLDQRVFRSLAEVAQQVGRTKQLISRYVQLAELPAVILGAFGDPRKISLRWVAGLREVLTQNERAVLRAAQSIVDAGKPIPASEVYDLLIGSVAGGRQTRLTVIAGADGQALGTLRRARNGQLIVEAKVPIPPDGEDELARQLAALFEALRGPP